MAAFVLNILRVLIIMAVLALLSFMFLMLAGNPNGALLGQIGSLLSILAAIGIFIVAVTINNNINEILGGIAGGSLERFITTGASLSTYFAIAFGVLSMLFITVRKDILRNI